MGHDYQVQTSLQWLIDIAKGVLSLILLPALLQGDDLLTAMNRQEKAADLRRREQHLKALEHSLATHPRGVHGGST